MYPITIFLLLLLLSTHSLGVTYEIYRYPVEQNISAHGSRERYFYQTSIENTPLFPQNYNIFTGSTGKKGNILCENFHDICLNKAGTWTLLDYDATWMQLTRSADDPCLKNNGGCQHKCKNVDGWPLCLCSENLYPLFDGGCKEIEAETHYIISGTNGTFSSPGGAASAGTTWTIVAPKGYGITLEFSLFLVTGSCEIILTDGEKTEKYSNRATKFSSNGNIIELKVTENFQYSDYTENDYSNKECRFIFQASYKTGFVVMESYGQSISTSFYARPDTAICILMTYSLINSDQTNVVPNIFLQSPHTYQTMYRKQLVKYNDLRTDIFTATTTHSFTHYKVFIQFSTSTRVFLLRECNEIEKHFLANSEELTVVNGETEDALSSHTSCMNGGEMNLYGECSCPVGFTGKMCEEGCGPNKYGDKCQETCSGFSSECKGLFFCANKKCSCAPGYSPPFCSQECRPKRYGANCSQVCGHCYFNCDPYTGKCEDDCEPGYRPPMCQDSFPHLTKQPHILEVGTTSVKIQETFSNINGVGNAEFYEVQYTKSSNYKWTKMLPQKLTDEVMFNITGLLPNTEYLLRIVLYTGDWNKNTAASPTIVVQTKCIVPDNFEINLFTTEVADRGFTLRWNVTKAEFDWCPLRSYYLTLTAGEETANFSVGIDEERLEFLDLQPNFKYCIQMSAISNTGKTISSAQLNVTTASGKPGVVLNVRYETMPNSTIILSWEAPWNFMNDALMYRISYECEQYLFYQPAECSSKGFIDTNISHSILSGLFPFAHYRIDIMAISSAGSKGTVKTIFVNTQSTAPTVAPSPAEHPLSAVWSNGATVHWSEPKDCEHLNGFLVGYNYMLLDETSSHLLQQGSVAADVTYINFTTMEPDTRYQFVVVVETSGGRGSVNLTIPIHTPGSSPDAVQNLVAYKRSRRMIGLRWAKPQHTYGELTSFSISYQIVNTSEVKNISKKPKQCPAWPNLYCQDITGIKPGKYYSVTIRAQNEISDAEGDSASIIVHTKEEVASLPTNLQAVNVTENSLVVQWGPPDMFNGILRSFLILVEKSSTSSEDCCEPVISKEYHVSSEQPQYQFEVTNLEPEMTYLVTVSAKTIVLGEAELLTVTTLPKEIESS